MPGYPRHTVRGRGRAREALATNWSINVANLIRSTDPANLIGYWPLDETTGTVATDYSGISNPGAYAGTLTLAGGLFGNKGYASFGGGRVSFAASLTNLNAVFNGALGTLLIWGKVLNAGVLTDTTARMLCEIGSDANNRVFIQKTSTNNLMQLSYRAGGTAENINFTLTNVNWNCYAITWNKSLEVANGYMNGVAGTPSTTLGVYAGALASAFTAIGDFQSAGGGQPYSGYLAHCAVWKTELTAAQIARLYIPRFAA